MSSVEWALGSCFSSPLASAISCSTRAGTWLIRAGYPPPAVLAPEARRRMAQSRAVIEAIVARDEAVYGVTTGFGDLATKRISPADANRLQENLLVTHAGGGGPRLDSATGRAWLSLGATTPAPGFTGGRP